jgi:hypothetical protein
MVSCWVTVVRVLLGTPSVLGASVWKVRLVKNLVEEPRSLGSLIETVWGIMVKVMLFPGFTTWVGEPLKDGAAENVK